VWTDKKTNTRFTWEDRLGQQTLQFIEYFYQNPARVTEIDAAYLEKKCYLEDLYPNLHFTFTHDLNRQLYEFLRKMGYAEPEIAFIREHEKVMPKQGGRNEKQNWEKYYTPELKAKVRHHERMLFEMFPEFDV
jgi:hypothetical protein